MIITIIFTENSGLWPFFLTAANRIKMAYPDVLIEKRVLPRAGQGGDNAPDVNSIFEIQVDGRKIAGNGANKKLSNSVGTAFVPMKELELAISRARKRRRPTTFYGKQNENSEAVRLDMLRKAKIEDSEYVVD